MTNTQKNLITKRAAATRAGVSMNTIDYWFRTGKLIKYANGTGRIFVDADALEKLITPVPVASGE